VQLHGFNQEFSIDDVKFTLVLEPATWVLALVALGGLFAAHRCGVRLLARSALPSDT